MVIFFGTVIYLMNLDTHSVVVSFCHIGYFYTCQDIPTEHVTPPNVRSAVKLGKYSYTVEVDQQQLHACFLYKGREVCFNGL